MSTALTQLLEILQAHGLMERSDAHTQGDTGQPAGDN